MLLMSLNIGHWLGSNNAAVIKVSLAPIREGPDRKTESRGRSSSQPSVD